MKNQRQINSIKKKIVPILKKNGIKKAGIFGSYARGEAKKSSDIDILIQIKKGKKFSLFDMGGLKVDLEEKIGKKVDLIEYPMIHPKLKNQILKEEIKILWKEM